MRSLDFKLAIKIVFSGIKNVEDLNTKRMDMDGPCNGNI